MTSKSNDYVFQVPPTEQPLSTDAQSPTRSTADQTGHRGQFVPMESSGYAQPTGPGPQNEPWKAPMDYDAHALFPGGSYGVRLLELEEMVKAIASSRHPFFRSTTDRNGNQSWRRTSLGNLVYSLRFSTELNIPGAPQTEYVKLFFKHFYALDLQDVYFTWPGDTWRGTTNVEQGPFNTLAEIFNELARVIQLEGRTQAFQDRIAAIDEEAFEMVLIRESQTIKDLQEMRERISKKRSIFLHGKSGIYSDQPAQSKTERDALRQSFVQAQLNRFAIARMNNAKKLIERQLVIARAWQGVLICRL